jgi:hypothetical protein
MPTNNGNSHTRATRALDRILGRPKQALLGWQKSDTEIVISAPGGLGRVYITWPESGTRDTAVNRRGVPLAGRLPILVVPGAPNVIVDIDTSDMAAVAAVFNGDYGTPPHAATHQHGGSDEVGTATPAANAIPKADASGLLDDWVTHTDVEATIDAAADLGAPADTDKLAAVRGGSLGTILVSALKTAFDALYGRLAAANTWTQINTFSIRVDAPVVRALTSAGIQLQDDAGNPALAIVDGGNTVVIGSATYVEPYTGYDAQGNVVVFVRYPTAHSTAVPIVGFVFANNQTDGTSGNVATLNFINEAIAAADKRIAQFVVQTDAATDEGKIILRTLDGGVSVDVLTLLANGNAGVNVAVPTGKLHVDQGNSAANIPTLVLDQSDLSEEFIEFASTIGAGNPIDTAALGTYYGKIRVSVNGVHKYIGLYDS